MYSGMLTLFVASYATVLVAELVGDKTLYTLGSLATQFRLGPILVGAAMAFMIKMLIAVLLGRQLAELPESAVSAVHTSRSGCVGGATASRPASAREGTSRIRSRRPRPGGRVKKWSQSQSEWKPSRSASRATARMVS